MSSKRLKSYVRLVKPRMTLFLLVSVALGYFYAGGFHSLENLFPALAGSALLAFSCFALNQVLEVEWDSVMARTKKRPLPVGDITPKETWLVGILMGILGTVLLWSQVNLLSSVIGLSILLIYAFIYTPLKRWTTLNTLLGAVPGALPPVLGWCAVKNSIGPGAVALFLILYFWQIPHFLALAWIYREDYSLADYKMLTVVDPTGSLCFRQILFHTVMLCLASFVPFAYGMAGFFYLTIAMVAGGWFFFKALSLHRNPSLKAARSVFYFSLIYLPVVYLFLALDG